MPSLDLTLDAKTILINKVNQTNGLSLAPADFTISNPTVVSSTDPHVNTKVTLSPNTNTSFYGTRDLFYGRLDIGNVCSQINAEILALTGTNLSDIINDINAGYGLNLKSTDYVNVALPAYNPLTPAARRYVTLTASATSLLFTGSFNVPLGPKSPGLPGTVSRTYLVMQAGLTLANAKQTILSLNEDGTTDNTFSFMSNVTAITAFSLTKAHRLSTGDIILLGTFNLTYTGSDALSHTVAGTTMVINSSGVVTAINSVAVYGTNAAAIIHSHPSVAFKYVIDSLDTTNTARLYKYLEAGGKTTFTPAITYVPTMVRVADDGTIYTVSPSISMVDPFNSGLTRNFIRIDRLLPTGSLDTSFTPIYMKSSDSVTNASALPLPVLDVCPMHANGIYVVVNPLYGVDGTAIHPIVNNVDLVATGTISSMAFSWNPIVKFNSDGSRDLGFKPLLKYRSALTVYNQTGSPLVAGGNVLCANGYTSVAMLSYKTNPATGHTYQHPIVFDSTGNLLPVLDNDYLNMAIPTPLLSAKIQTNGAIVSYGAIRVLDPNAGFTTASEAVFRYLPSGAFDRVLFRPIAGITVQDVKVREITL